MMMLSVLCRRVRRGLPWMVFAIGAPAAAIVSIPALVHAAPPHARAVPDPRRDRGETQTLTGTAAIDLNSASPAALERLPGVGPKRAGAIVDRRAKRKFRTVEELRTVRGFGPKLFRRLRTMLRAGP